MKPGEHGVLEGYRLSPQQRRLWQLQAAEPDQPYRAQCAILIEGDLDPAVLAAALDDVVGRHETLRTTFRRLPGMVLPLQVIAQSGTTSLQVYDLGGQDDGDQQSAVDSLLREAGRAPFDLEAGPLLRLSLVQLSRERRVLLVSLPALCADATALDNMASEIGRCYAARSSGEVLPATTMQYADYSEWHNELLEETDAAAGKAYWRAQDLSALPALRLPFEIQARDGKRFQPASLTLALGPGLTSGLEKLAGEHQTSAAALLLACWQILLFRLTGEASMVVGSTFAGRNYEGLGDALGVFAKNLPLCCRLQEDSPFREVLRQADEATRAASEWQECFTWDELATSTAGLTAAAFFPFGFEWEDLPATYSGIGVTCSMYRRAARVDRTNLTLSCRLGGDLPHATLHYDASLYPAEDVGRVAEQFRTLLASVIERPDAVIGDLELLGETERRQVLVGFNGSGTPAHAPVCIHRLFEAQVEHAAGRVAAVYESEQVTYAELNARANQLAHYLRKLGVGPDVPVALCLERGLELIVGLLGILKAGGAYVPLDPVLPAERRAFMLEAARAAVLVTRDRLMNAPPGQAVHVVDLASSREAIAREDRSNPPGGASPENLVYVLFTSGSTGTPKGVAVEHRQLANYVHGVLERLELPAGAGFAMVATLAADTVNTAIFPALCTGGCLHVISQERAVDPTALGHYFRSHRVDCLKIVVSHLRALLAAPDGAAVLPRQRLVVGGEACDWALIDRVRALAPDCVILNHYGPTEATVGAATYRVARNSAGLGAERPPIGHPIANTRAYVVNRYRRPAPVGVPGELYLGGACVARGYLGRPAVTAERFVPDPFGGEPGGRLYKTGDRVRWRADGTLEFLGRLDVQIKLRGYRIEPGEIEALLRQHQAVRESVVVAREDVPGEMRLVGYVVPQPGLTPAAAELRGFLQARLPDYMVPVAFVFLDRLPLTPSGKTDRRALPAPARSGWDRQENAAAPRTPAEAALAGIWAEALGLDRVGIHDNFFDLGGDSILSIQIIARSHKAGLRLTPRQLFEHQTVAELASVANTVVAVSADQNVVTGSVPLTPIQHRFFERALPEPHHYNQARLFEVRQAPDLALLERAVMHLLVHHDALRLRLGRARDGWEQHNAGAEVVGPVCSRVDLSDVPEAEQGAAIEAAAGALHASLNLADGPLVRIAVFELGAGRPARLLFIVHHLAVDVVSWHILSDDLEAAYRQLTSNEAVHLAPKTTSFRRWAERLTEHARSAALRSELPYWLDPARTQVDPLPVDFPGGTNTEATTRSVLVALSEEETRALLQEVPAAYRTQINDVLLTAVVEAFAEWTGSRRLLLSLEGHGREELFPDVDLTRTVGWFTAIFPVLLDLEGVRGSGAALKAVKEQLRQVPNRGIGYGLLRYLSGDPEVTEQLRGLPPAAVSFNYLGQFDQPQSVSSLFSPAGESSGLAHSLRGSRTDLLDVVGRVQGGQLSFVWYFSEQVHRRATVERLARAFVETLRELIAHCRSAEAGDYTPSDFPDVNLDQAELDELLARFDTPVRDG